MKGTEGLLHGLPESGDGLVTATQNSTKLGLTMKRKWSSKLLAPTTAKKMKPVLREPVPYSFVRIVQQYGLLKSIVSHLQPEDLLALALSAKAFYHAIVPRRKSIENLLGRMQCPGRGIQIRRRCHQKSVFFNMFECTEYVTCGSIATDRVVKTRPCVECKVATCDECRIHCVYQSIYEKPCAEDELPNFSGFIMLNAKEVPILSPHHLHWEHVVTEPKWQDPSTKKVGPYHDSGSIDSPLEESAYGPPENINHILDLDLGQNSLAFSSYSNVADPSPVLRDLYKTTEQRKRWFCDDCLLHIGSSGKNLLHRPCHCTLRGRYLDRWLCLRCYEDEEEKLQECWPTNINKCGCGNQIGRAICTWCWGSVMGPIEG